LKRLKRFFFREPLPPRYRSDEVAALQNSGAQGAVTRAGTSYKKRTSNNAHVAMALLVRTFRAAVGLPWSTLELLDRARRWSAVPAVLEAVLGKNIL
jgi:hypothetical protein